MRCPSGPVFFTVKKIFGNIQKPYDLFATSTGHWKFLKETTGVTLYSVSQMRWSAGIDAIKPSTRNSCQMLHALEKMEADINLPAVAFSENLMKWMKSFEFIFVTTLTTIMVQNIAVH